jgi:hypothetical protein
MCGTGEDVGPDENVGRDEVKQFLDWKLHHLYGDAVLFYLSGIFQTPSSEIFLN